MHITVAAYDDPDYKGVVIRGVWRWAIVIATSSCWFHCITPNVALTSLAVATGFWCWETMWNTFTIPAAPGQKFRIVGLRTPNPRRGHLSTLLQWWLNVLMIGTMMPVAAFLGLGNVWLYTLFGFPVALYAMEIVQVAVSLLLFGKRPWAKYRGPLACINGAISLSLWPAWVFLGAVAWFAWPAIIAYFS